MKSLYCVLLYSALGVINLLAQASGNTAAMQAQVPEPGDYSVLSMDSNSQIWERTEYELNSTGQVVGRKHRYSELATGLYYKDINGNWQSSQEEIDISPDGTASATKGQHQVYFPNNIYTGTIKLVTPDGLTLKSQPVALSYDDGSNTVLIAVLTNSVGQLVDSNQMIYPDAFLGVDADVRYTYRKSGFEQDIVLHQQPPSPAALGLNPETTRLQVLTEFINPPQPGITLRQLKFNSEESEDAELAFGNMAMVQGKAFSLGANSNSGRHTRVNKSWTKIQNRQFLVEEIPITEVESDLESLPAPNMQTGLNQRVPSLAKGTILPVAHLAENENKPNKQLIKLAKSNAVRSGFVLDYNTLNGSFTNYTFRGDTTYYLSGTANLTGRTVLEGGTVIKFGTSGVLNVLGALICQTGPYRPAVFTYANDNSVGEAVSASIGTLPAPTTAISLNYGGVLHNLRITGAGIGIDGQGGDYTLTDIQLVNCGIGFDFNSLNFYAGNILMSQVRTNFSGQSFQGVCEQATIDNFTKLTYDVSGNNSTLWLNNALVTGGGSNGNATLYTNGVAEMTSSSGVYQIAGAGSYYLPTNSVYHNAGTTNINPDLLTDISTKTTYPPIVYSNLTLTGIITFSPQAVRDNAGAPDLGYHYDPVDYFFGGVQVTTNITFTEGTVMGWFELPGNGGPGYGISLPNYVTAMFNGTATQPCVNTRYDTVQEAGNSNWKDKGWLAGIIGAGSTSSAASASIINAKFTRFAMLNNDPNDVRDYYAYLLFQPADCEFWSGGFGGYIISINMTNCLFDCAVVSQDSGSGGNEVSIENSTFHNGSISMTTTYPLPVSILNSAFDGTTVSCTGYGANSSYSTYDYNAYTNSTDPFPVGGTHDVHVSGSFNWRSSWFGNYYQSANSPLIDKGSTTADQVGLYHFTTQLNQATETNSAVDIGYHYVATDSTGITYLINVDFGGGSFPSPETGPAAVGLNNADFWNKYTRDTAGGGYSTFGATTNLVTADNVSTTVGMTVADAPGDWGDGSADPMLYDYIYPFDGGNVTVTITNLPSGNYSLYTYSPNAKFQVAVGGVSGSVETAYESSTPITPSWVNGASYVVFTNLSVTSGQSVVLTVMPDSNVALISGLQLVAGGPPNNTTIPSPLDTNGDGIPDYLEDANGNGLFDAGDLGEWQISPYGLSGGNGLQVFTPLKP